jgi:acyl dehydratase
MKSARHYPDNRFLRCWQNEGVVVAMHFEEFYVGQVFEVSPVTITKEQIIAFATEYDPLALHLDDEYAKTTRFGALIASGVMTFMLIWAEFIRKQDPFGNELIAGATNHMSWAGPTYPGDVLNGTIRVVSVKQRNSHNGLVELSLTACNQKGESVIDGGAEVVVQRKT